MIYSKSKQFCFVHIQKTAGSSLMNDLRQQVPDGRKVGKSLHMPARMARAQLGPAVWDACYTFAFVRNPWDRLVSWYTMISAHDQPRLRKRFLPALQPWRKPLALWDYLQKNASSFPEFITNCTGTVIQKGVPMSFTTNQIDYIVDERGKDLVEFVGRFERFEDDYNTVRQRLGLELRPLPHIKHKSKHEHYSSYYTDELRDIVGERFAQDIERFGYTFEDQRSG